MLGLDMKSSGKCRALSIAAVNRAAVDVRLVAGGRRAAAIAICCADDPDQAIGHLGLILYPISCSVTARLYARIKLTVSAWVQRSPKLLQGSMIIRAATTLGSTRLCQGPERVSRSFNGFVRPQEPNIRGRPQEAGARRHCLGQAAALALASEAIGRADQHLMPVEFLRALTKVGISVFQAGRYMIGDHSLDAASNQPSVPIVG